MLIVMVHSVNCVKHMEEHPWNEQVVYGQQGHSPTGKEAVEKMKDHASSDGYIQANQEALAHLTT